MKRLLWLLPLLISLCFSLAACVGPENGASDQTTESSMEEEPESSIEDGGRI